MDAGRPSPESDRELVRAMLAGDGGAFERFFDAAYPALYRFALARLGGNRDGAVAGEAHHTQSAASGRRTDGYDSVFRMRRNYLAG